MISSLGRVKSLAYDIVDSIGRHVHRKEKLMKVRVCSSTGYPQVNLWVGEKNKPFSIHRLIAEAFIPNPNNYPCVNHIDEDRSNSVLTKAFSPLKSAIFSIKNKLNAFMFCLNNFSSFSKCLFIAISNIVLI